MKTISTCVLTFAALSLGACGGAAVPEPEMVTAKSSVSAAEAVGAEEQPQAALHLKLAKDGIGEAERLIDEGENERAKRALERARADADVALALAKEAETRKAAQEAIDKVESMKKEGGAS